MVTRDELGKEEQMDFSRKVRSNVLAPYNPNTHISIDGATFYTFAPYNPNTQADPASLSEQFEMSTGNGPPDLGPLY